MSHLGDLVAALVDGELSHDGRDRALAHVAGCAECRAEVDRHRRLKAVLANQADPEPSADLQARLRGISDTSSGTPAGSTVGGLRLGEPSAASPRRSWFPATAAAFGPAPARPAGRSAGRLAAGGAGAAGPTRPGARRRTVRRLVAGSASALALTAALAVVGSADAGGPPKVRPPVDQFLQEHTRTTARLPLGDAGVGFVEATFTR